MKTSSNTSQLLHLGLDVHKAETVIAILEPDRDAEPRHYGSISTTQHALERAMRRIAKSQKCELSDLHVCYEASGCGFWIARRLLQMGIRCDVIAPSLIPVKIRRPGQNGQPSGASQTGGTTALRGPAEAGIKRDAMKIAKNLCSNDLVAAMVTVSEIGTFTRFEHPKKLMAFLGLAPTEQHRRLGGVLDGAKRSPQGDGCKRAA